MNPDEEATDELDMVAEAGEESFPASDPPSTNPLHIGRPNRRMPDLSTKNATAKSFLAALPATENPTS